MTSFDEFTVDVERALRQGFGWVVDPIAGFFVSNARCFGAFAWVAIYWLLLHALQPWVAEHTSNPSIDYGMLYGGLAGALIVLSGIVTLRASDRRKSTEENIKHQAHAIADALVFAPDQLPSTIDPFGRQPTIVDRVISEARRIEFGEQRDPEPLCDLMSKLQMMEPKRTTNTVEVAHAALQRARSRRDFGPTDLPFTWTAILFGFFFCLFCEIFHSASGNLTFAIGAVLATAFSVNSCFTYIDDRYF